MRSLELVFKSVPINRDATVFFPDSSFASAFGVAAFLSGDEGRIWGRSRMSRTEKLEFRGILISRILKISKERSYFIGILESVKIDSCF